MKTLEVVIGLIFIYLLLSLLASVVQELFSNLSSLRGKLLLKSVAKLLELDNKVEKQALFDKITSNSVYRKYITKGLLGGKNLPSYLSANQFLSVVKDLLQGDGTSERSLDGGGGNGGDSPVKLDTIKDNDLRNSLETLQYKATAGARDLTDEVKAEAESAEQAIAKYFNEMMDMATAWYRRYVQYVLIAIGFLIALSFDADTFQIFRNLTNDNSARAEVLQIATNFVDNDKITVYQGSTDSTTLNQSEAADQIDTLKNKLSHLLTEEIEANNSSLGLGWKAENIKNLAFGGWLLKVLGWLITALAISLGAPFWYDMLRSLINIRGATGQAAAGQAPPQTTVKIELPENVEIKKIDGNQSLQ